MVLPVPLLVKPLGSKRNVILTLSVITNLTKVIIWVVASMTVRITLL